MGVEWLAEAGSTMDEARLRADQGAPHGTVVAAKLQRGGRGRHGRSWSSPDGNLYATVVLRPAAPADRAAELGFVASLAVAEAVDRVAGPMTGLKWPNDVLRGGAKLAGLLLERLHYGAVLVGFGVNIRHAPMDVPYPVTSLAAEGRDPTPATLLDEILASLDAGYGAWQASGLPGVLEQWLQRGPAPQSPIRVRLPDGIVSGAFAGLAADGSLLVDTPGGRHRLIAGDVLL